MSTHAIPPNDPDLSPITRPVYLLPGWMNSDPDHWQSRKTVNGRAAAIGWAAST